MYVGSFGDIPFIVARGYVRTFKDYGRESSGRWAKHDISARSRCWNFWARMLKKSVLKCNSVPTTA